MSAATHLARIAVVVAALTSGVHAQSVQEPNRGGALDLASEDPKVALERLKVADGYEVNLFASEVEFPELAGEVAEEGEGLSGIPLFTHEKHRHLRQQQIHGRDGAHNALICEHADALAERAITDLVVILNERNERDGR